MPRIRDQRKYGPSRRWRGLVGLAMVVGMLTLPPILRGAMPDSSGASSTSPSSADLHAFTDPSGASGITVKAEVISMVGDTVNLKREGGKSWSEPMSYFTPADQAYILESLLRQRTARGHAAFTITAIPIKTAETTTPIKGGVGVRWQEAYKINLKNETLMKMTNLQVRCIVFKTPLVPDVSGNYNLALELHAQTLPVDETAGSTTKSILTDQIGMQALQARGAYFPNAPNAHAETDQLTAVWVRVFDSNNFMIQEWCSSPEIFKQGNWDDEWQRGGGTKARARGAAGSAFVR